MSYAADVLSRERDQTARRADELAAELRALKARLRELDEAIVTLGGAPAALARGPVSREPAAERLIDRIEKMLAVDGAGTSPSELAARLKEAGRETSGETVASLLSRLKKDGLAEKRGRGWYRSTTSDRFMPVDEVRNGQATAQTETEDDAPASSSVVNPT